MIIQNYLDGKILLSNNNTFELNSLELKTYTGQIGKPKPNQCLVMGVNPEFRHGKGIALIGVKYWGAIYGKGGAVGKTYSIITKDLRKRKHPSVPSYFIIEQIGELYEFAQRYAHVDFLIPYRADSNNLNGYSPQEMADMFSSFKIPENIVFEEGFSKLIK